MKYKFILNEPIKRYVEWSLEHYNEYKQELELQKSSMMPALVPGYSAMPRGSEPSRQTENVAMRLVTSAYINNLEQTVRAIDNALANCDDVDKKLISLIYWQRAYNVIGAGIVVGLSASGAYKRINKILSAIAAEMGLVSI